ncbi:BppU family phage baseplate upper protein [Bacillus thuringiensis]|uniref:BppU N-terminal domain-containing protein n=2 Tax=Bacillati TaxID=1783272 RepID=A0A9W3SP81_BACTU|nr:hypothetical protein BTI247_04950 [Bacillus thuringiensis Bt18247]
MAELLKVREITIDTIQHKEFNRKEEELKLIRFYQNDLNSAKLLINVTHDKVVTDFSSAISVQIAFLKPDGKRVFQDVQNVNQMQGKYYVVLSTQTLIAYGNVIAQLRFTFPNNKVIETCMLAFTVDESIMSDDAMKSTNEFPVIQKAIEVGEKFKGVDFAPIIKAGELAAGAVKRSGDTMTGSLYMDVASTNRSYGWRRADGKLHYIYAGADVIALFSDVPNKSVWQYIPSTDTFNVNANNTNMLKKAGDTMTGDLNLDKASGARYLAFSKAGTAQYYIGTQAQDKFHLRDQVANTTVFEYDPVSKVFTMFAETNLVKKSGDSFTGQMVLAGTMANLKIDDKAGSIQVHQPTDVTTSARGMQFYEGGATVGGVGRLRNGAGIDQMYMGWGANPWSDSTSLTVSDTKFQYKGKPVAMRDKDGLVNLTLTADATNANAGYMPIADRRGNTVTVRMEVTRNVGSASPLICTLPVDVRPANTISMNFLANDGSVVGVNISWDGKIEIYTTGKQTKIVATYVVN